MKWETKWKEILGAFYQVQLKLCLLEQYCACIVKDNCFGNTESETKASKKATPAILCMTHNTKYVTGLKCPWPHGQITYMKGPHCP